MPSSSAKKVARVAAKSGTGQPIPAAANTQRNWMFVAAIIAVVVVGLGLVVFARQRNSSAQDNSVKPRANLNDGTQYDSWHSAFAISVCGKELPAIQPGASSALGIDTTGDGLIGIAPTSLAVAGKKATLGKFFDQVGLRVTDQGFRMPPGSTVDGTGTTVLEGKTTCAGKPGELVLAEWKDARTASTKPPTKIYRSNFGSVNFKNDFSAYTLAYVPKGTTKIPAPSSADNIESLVAAEASSSAGSAGTGAPGSGSAGTGSTGTGSTGTGSGGSTGATG